MGLINPNYREAPPDGQNRLPKIEPSVMQGEINAPIDSFGLSQVTVLTVLEEISPSQAQDESADRESEEESDDLEDD